MSAENPHDSKSGASKELMPLNVRIKRRDVTEHRVALAYGAYVDGERFIDISAIFDPRFLPEVRYSNVIPKREIPRPRRGRPPKVRPEQQSQ